jgi:RNA polymerase sigma-70 factor (ECF subfamily)
VDDLTRLALAAGSGDRVALSTFVRRSQPDVWRLCRHLTDRSSADDVTQQTYERALRALPSFRADASARTWLLAIARHVCADHLRHQGRRRRLAERLSLPTQPDRGATGEADLRDLVGRLAPRRRDAFVLTQWLGLSYAEAAAVCGCPVGTIRSRVARSREELLAAWTGRALPAEEAQ